MTNAIDNYLHFYFDDAEIEDNLISEKDKFCKKELEKQIEMADERQKKALYGTNQESLEEATKILNILTSNDESSTRKKIYNQELANIGQQSGISDKTYTQINKMKLEDIENLIGKTAEKIVESIDNFKKELEEYLEKAYKQLTKENNWKEYQAKVIGQYIIAKNFPIDSSDIKKSILEDYLIHEGIKKLDIKNFSDRGGFETALRNLTLLAYSLPEMINYSSKEFYYSTSRTKKDTVNIGNGIPELFKVISGKISGGFKNLTGLGAEIAWEKAELEGMKELGENFKIIHEALEKENIIVKQTGSDSIERKDSNNKTIKRVAKGDVIVEINHDGIKISYGISVKNYTKPKNSNNIGHIAIGKYSNFLDLATAKKEAYTKYEILHFGAAEYDKKRTTEKTLKKNWQEIKHQVVIYNLLDLIAGQAIGNDARDNILIVVVNGKILKVTDVLEEVYSSLYGGNKKEKIENKMSINASSIQRDALRELNKYREDKNRNGNEDEAKARGTDAWKKVSDALRNAKIQASLYGIAKML